MHHLHSWRFRRSSVTISSGPHATHMSPLHPPSAPPSSHSDGMPNPSIASIARSGSLELSSSSSAIKPSEHSLLLLRTRFSHRLRACSFDCGRVYGSGTCSSYRFRACFRKMWIITTVSSFVRGHECGIKEITFKQRTARVGNLERGRRTGCFTTRVHQPKQEMKQGRRNAGYPTTHLHR